jgi:hypothetical protein
LEHAIDRQGDRMLREQTKALCWGHGAVQRALLVELQKQQQAIDTMSLLRIICDGDDLTHARAQSGRRALRTLSQEGAVIAYRNSAGVLFWRITTKITHTEPH